MSDTPRTNSLKAQYFNDSIELDDVFSEIGKLERMLRQAQAERDESDNQRKELYDSLMVMIVNASQWREIAEELGETLKVLNYSSLVPQCYLPLIQRFDEMKKGAK